MRKRMKKKLIKIGKNKEKNSILKKKFLA